MASVTSTIGTALSGISAISSVIGGLQSMGESKTQSKNAQTMAEMQAADIGRTSAREAQFVKDDALNTERRQKLAFLASGVSLEGSPLLLMEETRRKGSDNVEEIIRSGVAGSSAARMEGRIKAQQLKSAGRQSFVSGLTNAGTAVSRMFNG